MTVVTCHRCGGTGKIPQYSWNKGGVCFTCGGDGKLNTLTTNKLNRLEEKEVEPYLRHVSTRDMANLVIETKLNLHSDSKISTFRKELVKRAERLGLNYGYGTLTTRIARDVVSELDKAEEEIPKPWKKDVYVREGKVSEVPAHWLSKFQGNALRRDVKEMAEFSKSIRENGIDEPVMIIIGQEDRRVSIGEGNHRTFGSIGAGLDKVPARVVRQRTNSDGVYYDKMGNVPVEDYFKADARPEEVFDTFWDGDYLPEDPKSGEEQDTSHVDDIMDYVDDELDDLDLEDL